MVEGSRHRVADARYHRGILGLGDKLWIQHRMDDDIGGIHTRRKPDVAAEPLDHFVTPSFVWNTERVTPHRRMNRPDRQVALGEAGEKR